MRAIKASTSDSPVVVGIIFRHYNDIDHMVPVSRALLDLGVSVRAIVTGRVDFAGDARTRDLQSSERFSIHQVAWLSLRWSRVVWNRYVSSSPLAGIRNALVPFPRVLRTTTGAPIAALVHDFGGTERYGFHAARSRGIPNICIPHGYNIFRNIDVTRRLRQRGGHSYANRSAFDAYVTNSQRHLAQLMRQGLDPGVCLALGSARFDKKYSAENLARMPQFAWPSTNTCQDSVLRVVYYEPHKDYNVNVLEQIQLLGAICELDEVSVVIKAHTRSGSSISSRERACLESHGAFFVHSQHESPSIVRSADVVVCFGSSIGIEALLQRKPLINAPYLHSNTTIFDQREIALQADSTPRLINLLKGIARSASRAQFLPSPAALDEFLEAEVFGEELASDAPSIASRYATLILRMATQFP